MASPRFDANQLVKDFERAFNSKSERDVVRKYYDPNVEWGVDMSGNTQRGLDAFQKAWEQWADNFTDTKLEIMQVVHQGNDVAILQRTKGRHTGDGFELTPGEKIPATNKTVNLVVAEFIKLDDQGKIVRDLPIMDQSELMRQLGVLPSPGQDAAARRAVPR